MRAATLIAGRDLRSQLRSRSFITQSLVLPLLLTAIIGTALGGNTKPEPAAVALVGQEGALTSGLAKFLGTDDAAKVSSADEATARAGVRAGKFQAAVILPPGLQRQLSSPRGKAAVTIVTDPGSQVAAFTVVQLTRSYLATLEAGRAAVLAVAQVRQPGSAEELGRIVASAQTAVQADLAKPDIGLATSENAVNSGRYFAYFAIAFGVLFALLSAAMAAGGLVDEVERGTLTRLRAAPVSAWALTLGKVSAIVLTTAVQLVVFTLATHFLFGARWGAPTTAAVVIACASIGAAGLGGFILGVAQSHEQVMVLTLMIVLLMSLLGGSMWPVESLPGAVQVLSRFTYNRWAIEAFQTVSVPGLGLEDAVLPLAVLLAVGLAGLLFGGLRVARMANE